MKNLDPIKLTQKLPKSLQLPALSRALDFAIPFNFGLGFRITKLTPSHVELQSRETRRRKNHVGSAHACFLALLSEYPAGLMLAQRYPFDRHRIIISELKIQYFKQGRGTLRGIVLSPTAWPELQDGACFVDLETEILNSAGERVSICQTKWQIKEWSKVRSPKKA